MALIIAAERLEQPETAAGTIGRPPERRQMRFSRSDGPAGRKALACQTGAPGTEYAVLLAGDFNPLRKRMQNTDSRSQPAPGRSRRARLPTSPRPSPPEGGEGEPAIIAACVRPPPSVFRLSPDLPGADGIGLFF